MPRGALGALQLDRLRWTAQHAYSRVPFHRRRFDEAGVSPADMHSLDDLRRLPFTRKADLRDHYPTGLFAVAMRDVARIHASSGTRGKPTIVGYTRQDVDTWAEVCARSLTAGGVRPDSVVHVAYGYGLFTGGLGVHYGAERIGATVIPASGGNTPRQVLLMRDLKADVLCCTPSYALNIAESMRERGEDPRSLRLRRGIFGAEPWTEGMRGELEQSIGLEALDIYGLSEVMGPGVSMQSDEDGEGLFIWEDHFLPEIIDPVSETVLPLGSEGELVFTSLTKEAFPVIRYRTGDLCTLFAEPSASGRTMLRMTRLKGRTDDMMIVRGVNVFPSEIERVLLEIPGLAPHYQIHLAREQALDRLTVHVEVNADVYESAGSSLGHASVQVLSSRLRSRLAEMLGVGADVMILAPAMIPRSEGKAQRVVDSRGTTP